MISIKPFLKGIAIGIGVGVAIGVALGIMYIVIEKLCSILVYFLDFLSGV